jgi:hypothetical protein
MNKEMLDKDISADDLDLAKTLVAEGWYSVSNKYRRVARWSEPLPKVEDLIRPEMLHAPHVDRIIELWNKRWRPELDLRGTHPLIEERELTEPQYRAFRLAGGQSA